MPGEPPGSEEPRDIPREQQRVRVRLERAGRGGKTVTVAGPLQLPRADASTLLQALKRACGGGGTLKAGTTLAGSPAFVLELQGDHRARLPALLRESGFRQAR
jgi:translation initiation factor 1